MEILFNIVTSTLISVMASFFVWWYTFKYLVPKVRFSEKISKLTTDGNKSGFRYRFKFENYGKRNLIDTQVIVQLRIKGLNTNFPSNWNVYYLPTGNSTYNNVAMLKPICKKGLRKVLEIKPYLSNNFQSTIFPNEIIELSKEGKLNLEDLLKLGKKTELKILLLGYDEFSGIRKLYQSEVYKASDISEGSFKLNSLEINQTIKPE